MSNDPRTWEDFIVDAQTVADDAEMLEGSGEDFGQSVARQLRKMAQTVEANEHVTPRQWEALNNMRVGVRAWER